MDVQQKEDNYPSWMKEMLSKERDYSNKLQRVQQQQKTLVENLDKFDQNKAEQEKKFRMINLQKKLFPQEEQPSLQLSSEEYHQYYQNQKLLQNSKIKVLKLNPNLLLQIISFMPDPIITAIILTRVCKKWSIQLSAEKIWIELSYMYLGENYNQLNKSKSDFQAVAIYFAKNFKLMESFFRNHQKSGFAKDIQVQSLVKDALNSLKFLQQVISITWECKIVNDLRKFTSKLESSLTALSQCTHYVIRDEARQCLITLTKLHNYCWKKLFLEEDEILITKQILNQEVIKDQLIYFPVTLHYSWTSETNQQLSGDLRDYITEEERLKQLMVETIESDLFLYNRYKEEQKEQLQKLLCGVEINKKREIIVNAYSGGLLYMTISGNLKFQNLQPTYSQYQSGIKYQAKGIGNINIFNQGKVMQCGLYIIIGNSIFDQMSYLYLVGNNENQNIFMVKLL